MAPPNADPRTALSELVLSFRKNWYLILHLARREVSARYRGSVIGLMWSFINPLLMLLVYTFFFTVVFKARWAGAVEQNRAEFAIVLFAGLLVHNLLAECVTRAPALILSNVNFVKRVVFPLEALPWVAVANALFNTGMNVVVLLAAQLLINHHIPWTVLLFPVVLLPLVFGIMGVCWVLASLGVFVRDISHFIGMFVMMMLFMSPVFYPVSAVPERLQFWMYLNPMTFILEQSRNVLVWGTPPAWGIWVMYLIGSIAIGWVGFWWFQKTRKGFADVL